MPSRDKVTPVLDLLNFRPWMFRNDLQQSNVLELVVIVHEGLHKSTTILGRHECSFLQFAIKKKIFIYTNLEFIGLLALPRRLILCQCHTAVRIKGQLGSESDPCPTCFSRRAETGGTCVEFNWASPGGVWAAHTDLKNILVFREEPWSAEPLFGWLNLLVDEPQN